MRVGDAVWIRPDNPLRVALPLWADDLGRVAEAMQVDDEELRLAVSFCAPLAVEVLALEFNFRCGLRWEGMMMFTDAQWSALGPHAPCWPP